MTGPARRHPSRTWPKARRGFCTCQSLHRTQIQVIFWEAGSICSVFAQHLVSVLHSLAQRCKRFSPLLAAPAALLLSQGQAKALITYNVFESAGNVVVQASGSLDLSSTSSLGLGACGTGAPGGAIVSAIAVICTGAEIPSPAFAITGPASFDGFAGITPASSVSGITTGFNGVGGVFALDPSYNYNTLIVSSATFNGQTLASLGFTTTGLIGTWTIDGTPESINVYIGPPATSVPGPLPLLGAGAAFGWSRQLRKRIGTSGSVNLSAGVEG
jgi:hypothetical protein